jgi:hypothetical protein
MKNRARTHLPSPEPPDGPRREAIANRAYEHFQERGATEGHDLDDWLQAERELADEGRKPADS